MSGSVSAAKFYFCLDIKEAALCLLGYPKIICFWCFGQKADPHLECVICVPIIITCLQ